MSKVALNNKKDKWFQYFGIFSTLIGLVLLGLFIFQIAKDGFQRLSLDFIMNLPSRFYEKAGILPAWTGTLWIFALTAIIVIPVGVGAGIYLQEYAKKGRLSNILEINISNLAGVPSIIYGIIGLEVFVRLFEMGGSILAGSFTLSLLILPIIIVATREAIKAVPKSIKEASYGLGATKWQTIWHHVLPIASANIITGVILALARAIGETAPLIVIGALAYVPFVAKTPMDEFTVLPMQIFNWVSRPQHGFLLNAAAAILVLLIFVFILNGIAVYLRIRSRKKFGL
ncbi:MAG: phosphate ABC transporter permease PstA [Chitinophagaceae bacterium]